MKFYGHHRLIVLKELKTRTVDVPVRDFDDGRMLKAMADENLIQWKPSPGLVNETVIATKEYLDSVLVKCSSYEEIRAVASNRANLGVSNGQAFAALKKNGVGSSTIHNFLGDNWSQWTIKESLSTLKGDVFDREAIEMKNMAETLS